MKQTGIVLTIIGILGTLWGIFALVLAFGGYTPETSYLGQGVPSLGITYTYDEDGTRSPSVEEEEKLKADHDAQYQDAVKTHKTRGGLMLAGGVIVLVAGIALSRKSTKEE